MSYTLEGSKRVNQSSFNGSYRIKILLGKNGEYIEGKWQNNHLIKLFSFKFTLSNNSKTAYCRKQSPGYLFTFDEEDFIARVSFNKLEELRFAEPFTVDIKSFNKLEELIFAEPFAVDIKKSVLRKLILIEIIKDKLLNDRNTAYEQLRQLLQK